MLPKAQSGRKPPNPRGTAKAPRSVRQQFSTLPLALRKRCWSCRHAAVLSGVVLHIVVHTFDCLGCCAHRELEGSESPFRSRRHISTMMVASRGYYRCTYIPLRLNFGHAPFASTAAVPSTIKAPTATSTLSRSHRAGCEQWHPPEPQCRQHGGQETWRHSSTFPHAPQRRATRGPLHGRLRPRRPLLARHRRFMKRIRMAATPLRPKGLD